MRDLYPEINEVFRRVFSNETLAVGPGTSAADIDGWDSFTHMQLIDAIEKKFQVEFSYEEVRKFRNVGDIITLLQNKRK